MQVANSSTLLFGSLAWALLVYNGSMAFTSRPPALPQFLRPPTHIFEFTILSFGKVFLDYIFHKLFEIFRTIFLKQFLKEISKGILKFFLEIKIFIEMIYSDLYIKCFGQKYF